jgi:hypothetical protein
VELASNKESAQDGHEGNSDNGRTYHRKRLREGQGMKHLSFHPRQREHWHESQNDDCHREEYGTTHHLGCFEGDLLDG